MLYEVIETFFGEILSGLVTRFGAFVRWLFLKEPSYQIVLKQNWNNRVGFFTIVLIVTLIILVISS